MKEDGLEWKMQQRVKQGENLAEAIRFDQKKKAYRWLLKKEFP